MAFWKIKMTICPFSILPVFVCPLSSFHLIHLFFYGSFFIHSFLFFFKLLLPWPVWGPGVAAGCWVVCLSGRSRDVWGPAWQSVADEDPHEASWTQGPKGSKYKCETDCGHLWGTGTKRATCLDMDLYLGHIRYSVPVATGQAEVTVTYPVQDFVGGVLRPVGEWSKTCERKVDRWHKECGQWGSEIHQMRVWVFPFTQPAWCTVRLPDSRCHILHRTPDASTPLT